VNDELFHAFGVAKHGSTLGGSPFACRLGLEFLRVVEDEGLLAQVQDTGGYLLQVLQELAVSSPIAVEARGRGLLLGLELTQPARPIAEAALEEGVLLNLVQGNVLRFLPSFLLERQHVDIAAELLARLLGTAKMKKEEPVEALVPAAV